MAGVLIRQEEFSKDRLRKLATLTGTNMRDALGAVSWLWQRSQSEYLNKASTFQISFWLYLEPGEETEKYLEALCMCGYLEMRENDQFFICGNEAEIKKIRANKKRAEKGGRGNYNQWKNRKSQSSRDVNPIAPSYPAGYLQDTQTAMLGAPASSKPPSIAPLHSDPIRSDPYLSSLSHLRRHLENQSEGEREIQAEWIRKQKIPLEHLDAVFRFLGERGHPIDGKKVWFPVKVIEGFGLPRLVDFARKAYPTSFIQEVADTPSPGKNTIVEEISFVQLEGEFEALSEEEQEEFLNEVDTRAGDHTLGDRMIRNLAIEKWARGAGRLSEGAVIRRESGKRPE